MKWLKRGLIGIILLTVSIMSESEKETPDLNIEPTVFGVREKEKFGEKRFTIYPRDYHKKKIDSIYNELRSIQ